MVLKLNNLSKAYDNKTVLSDFSYTFKKTGLYFITGYSGVGKTTLLRMIAGLDNSYSGSIENGGIKNVSFMFQEYRLFPTLTAEKNASITQTNNAKISATEYLCRLGFTKDDLKKKPAKLSGGMKQRVAFVRALIKESPILILDEPTKELDQNTSNIMLDIIKEEAKKRLVIVVSHDDIHQSLEAADIITL